VEQQHNSADELRAEVGGSISGSNVVGSKNVRQSTEDRRQLNEITINEFAPSDIQAIYAKLARIEDNFNWRLTRLEDKMSSKAHNLNARLTDLERDVDYERRNPPRHGDRWRVASFLMTAFLAIAVWAVFFELLRLAR